MPEEKQIKRINFLTPVSVELHNRENPVVVYLDFFNDDIFLFDGKRLGDVFGPELENEILGIMTAKKQQSTPKLPIEVIEQVNRNKVNIERDANARKVEHRSRPDGDQVVAGQESEAANA